MREWPQGGEIQGGEAAAAAAAGKPCGYASGQVGASVRCLAAHERTAQLLANVLRLSPTTCRVQGSATPAHQDGPAAAAIGPGEQVVVSCPPWTWAWPQLHEGRDIDAEKISRFPSPVSGPHRPWDRGGTTAVHPPPAEGRSLGGSVPVRPLERQSKEAARGRRRATRGGASRASGPLDLWTLLCETECTSC